MASLFISAATLRENTLIDNNVDDKLLEPVILLCQDEYIKFTIGSDLYAELEAQILAGTTTALNRTLLDDYIIPCLKWYVTAESILAINFKIKNKGVVSQSSDNSTPVTMADAMKLHDRWLNKAQQYRERLRLYLVQHEESYPKFMRTLSSDIDTVRPANTGYNTGMYLGNDSQGPRERRPFSERYQGNYDSDCIDC